MSGYERQYHSETVWQIMLAVLDKQGAGLVKMAELIFTLPRLSKLGSVEMLLISTCTADS